MVIFFRRATKSAKATNRSSSADSNKKKISCDVSNLNNPGPNLQIIGTKTSIMQLTGNSNNSRGSTPEPQPPVIKKPLTDHNRSKHISPIKTKQLRTKEILQGMNWLSFKKQRFVQKNLLS